MKTAVKETRGMRNHNPLNIRWNPSVTWEGQTGHDSAGFCRFRDDLMGYRAAFANLRSYRRFHSVTKVGEIIARWAPPSENLTVEYVKFVCQEAHLNYDQEIDYRSEECRRMVKAMAKIESNMTTDDDILIRAQQLVL